MQNSAYNNPCSKNGAGEKKLARRGQAAPGVKKSLMELSDRMGDLGKIPLFSGLTARQLDWLRNRLYARAFPANQEVMVTGSPGDLVYIILSGTVKIYVPQLDGEDVIVAILGPGDPVGEMSLIDRTNRSASVITLETTSMLWMNPLDFKAAMESMPVLAQNMMRILSSRLRASSGQIQALAALDVSGRVVRQLLTYADRYGQPCSLGIEIPIRLTQNDLAALVGASRKRVNQAIVELKRAGYISIDHLYHITLHDRAALEKLA